MEPSGEDIAVLQMFAGSLPLLRERGRLFLALMPRKSNGCGRMTDRMIKFGGRSLHTNRDRIDA